MSAIEAASVGVRTMADGTLRLSLDIEPRHAQAAFALFGAPGTPMALAALRPASSKPEAPKGGPLAQWVAMRCQEPHFQAWLYRQDRERWIAAAGEDAEEVAANVIRAICGVDSRAELDSNPEAAARLHKLIREPYKDQA
jgi:hypothetical protein